MPFTLLFLEPLKKFHSVLVYLLSQKLRTRWLLQLRLRELDFLPQYYLINFELRPFSHFFCECWRPLRCLWLITQSRRTHLLDCRSSLLYRQRWSRWLALNRRHTYSSVFHLSVFTTHAVIYCAWLGFLEIVFARILSAVLFFLQKKSWAFYRGLKDVSILVLRN